MAIRSTVGMLSVLSLAVAVGGCFSSSGSSDSGSTGDDGGGGDSSSQSITGTAAQGAPLSSAQVTANCVNGDSDLKTVTDESGAFEIKGIDEDQFPCGVKASIPDSKDAFYSFAQQPGKANVTPYTDMVTSVGSDKTSSEWFNSLDSAGFSLDQSRIDDAVKRINDELKKLGLPVESINPMKADFEIGDEYDKSMDRFMAGIENDQAIDSFSDLRNSLKDGNPLSDVVASVPDSVPGGDDPQSPGGNASYAQCWNESLFTPGSSVQYKVRQTVRDQTEIMIETQTVENRSGDKVALIRESTPEDPDGQLPAKSSESIYQVDTDTPSTTELSSVVSGMKTTYSPGIITDYSLEEGESNSFEYEVVPEDNPDNSATVNQTSTFVGIETIDLPNMSGVEACRIEGTMNNSQAGSTDYTNWFAVGSGILLRNKSGGSINSEFAGTALPSN